MERQLQVKAQCLGEAKMAKVDVHQLLGDLKSTRTSCQIEIHFLSQTSKFLISIIYFGSKFTKFQQVS